MKQQEFDWRSGRVTFWDLDSVEETRSISDQLDELKEDLAQIEYPGELVLDVGWYPSFSEEGGFLVVVVRFPDWEHPLMQERCRSIEALRVIIGRAVLFAETSAQ